MPMMQCVAGGWGTLLISSQSACAPLSMHRRHADVWGGMPVDLLGNDRTSHPALQKVELKAEKVVHVGKVDAAIYPLAKKKTSYEFLREKAHLRPRTNTIGAHTAVYCDRCSLSDTQSVLRVVHLGWEMQSFCTRSNPPLKKENWMVHLPIDRRCESHHSPVYCTGIIRSWVWCDCGEHSFVQGPWLGSATRWQRPHTPSSNRTASCIYRHPSSRALTAKVPVRCSRYAH